MAHRRLATVCLTLLAACAVTSPTNTGLEGYVSRGPISPVCQPSVPCDEPMAATFTAWRTDVAIKTFQSDSTGQFRVSLAPGQYRIVPAPDTPVLDPESQAKNVTVLTDGYTHVDFTFDTGIR